MLAIRMQRTGRKGHAMFRVIVQESRRTPTSGSIVAALGSYDPHAKAVILDKEKAAFYLEHGAQPSERVARLLQNEGVDLPKWVTLASNKQHAVRHAEKRRSTTPAAPVEETPAAEAEAPAAEEATVVEAEAPVQEAAPTEAETPAEKPAAEADAPTEA